MFKKIKKHLLAVYAIDCLRAFKVIRDKEGEKEIFRELNIIQSMPLFSAKNTVNDDFQCALSQKLFHENLDKGLSSVVMLARYGYKKPIIMPYPKKWRQYLKKIGLKQHWISGAAFMLTIFIKVREAFFEIRSLLRYSSEFPSNFKNYIVFQGVPLNALDINPLGINLDNFLSYAKQKFPQNNLIFIGQCYYKIDEQATIACYPFLPLKSYFQKTKFLFNVSIKFCTGMVCGILGKWPPLYMLKDEIISQYIKVLDEVDLPHKIFFLNSHYIYKPLWAVFLEKRGIDVCLFFYSTNTYNIQFNDDEYGLISGYKQMTWNKFHTFHENHKEFLKKVINKSIIVEIEKDPINFVDCAVPLTLPDSPKIALFDVQPFRDSFLSSIGRPTNLYHYDVSKAIFEDILDWCIQNKTFMVIKPKRDVNNRLCPKYKKMLKELYDHKWCIVLNSNYSPKRVCEKVDLAICQPFTSAALSAEAVLKPAVYYDPTKILKKDQPACQGINLLQGREELYDFLNKTMRKR